MIWFLWHGTRSARIARWACRFGRCLECRVHDTDEGIGGKCVRCGTVHGWVTRAELRAYAERVTRYPQSPHDRA